MGQSSELGQTLREGRVRQGISLGALAQRTGFAKSTLSEWESGAKRPSGANLRIILEALGVDDGRKAGFLAEANDAVSREALVHSRLGAPIGLPDCLRGLRLRANLAQTEVGTRVGVSQSTVAKWESGERAVDSDLLPRLLDALGATPDEVPEILALRAEITVAGETREEIGNIQAGIALHLPYVLQDVAYTRLEARLWRLAVRNPQFEPMLIDAMSAHAFVLFHHLRFADADALAERALRMASATGHFDQAVYAGWTRYGIARERRLPAIWKRRAEYAELGDRARHSQAKSVVKWDLEAGSAFTHGAYRGDVFSSVWENADRLYRTQPDRIFLDRAQDLATDHAWYLLLAGEFEAVVEVAGAIARPSRMLRLMKAKALLACGEPLPTAFWDGFNPGVADMSAYNRKQTHRLQHDILRRIGPTRRHHLPFGWSPGQASI